MNNCFNRNAGFADENGNAWHGAYTNGRVPPRVERGHRGRGAVTMHAPLGVPHVGFRARNNLAAGSPVHAVRVGPPFHGGQLHGSVHNAPMFVLHPGVVNAVVIPHLAVNVAGAVVGAQSMHQGAGLPPHVAGLPPHVGADQQRRGAQPRNQGAGLPPHVVGLLNACGDQQGRSVREVMSEMMDNLVEVEHHYVGLYNQLTSGDEPVLVNAVIEPYAFHLVQNTEGWQERTVQNHRASLSETYARFACEEDMLGGFFQAVSEMYERFLFLLDVHINERFRASWAMGRAIY
ncbi:unnamed protein product [Heligmosomoides polygyrus]|uniref:Hemerythrin domain-containing protein n=1 Tax=Heligmosomoides polygyrus TaxID=6339 RepID=A0A183F858_HELPZ|nr:unnamed protein product [Heligmosomoides polygyrus]